MITVPLSNDKKYPVPSRPLCRSPAVYDQRNRILHQLKNGQNANFADFALTNKL